MAYYSYKEVRDLLPEDTAEKYLLRYGQEYEGEANYDGDQWTAAADYIVELLDKIKELESK